LRTAYNNRLEQHSDPPLPNRIKTLSQLCYCSAYLNLPHLTYVHSNPFVETSHPKAYSTQYFKTAGADRMPKEFKVSVSTVNV